HRGRVIPKEELLDTIWARVFVTEATLNRTITALRAAIGDDAERPRYIETVSRRGYKFIGEPAAVQQAAAPDFALVHGDRQYPLAAGEAIIGRGPDAAIPVFGSATSRQHARLVVSGHVVTLQDLGSRNGTYVNGRRVEGTIDLHPGDEIRIGSDCLVLWSRSSETGSLT
ncbi:MAG TPA: FHA domain-containing protein, partial [Thermoanaerobaculia bacterium]|nr:FHA domain-containing protein [Thermoanaerobaculia bacterium]